MKRNYMAVAAVFAIAVSAMEIAAQAPTTGAGGAKGAAKAGRA